VGGSYFVAASRSERLAPPSEFRSPKGSSPHALGASVDCGPGPELKCEGQCVSRYSAWARGVLSRPELQPEKECRCDEPDFSKKDTISTCPRSVEIPASQIAAIEEDP